MATTRLFAIRRRGQPVAQVSLATERTGVDEVDLGAGVADLGKATGFATWHAGAKGFARGNRPDLRFIWSRWQAQVSDLFVPKQSA